MEKKRHEKKLIVTPQIRQLSFDLKSAVKRPDEHGASVKLALFLGAGASFQSEIPVATGMIRHFKSEIYRRFGKKFKTEKEGEEWLKNEPWYNPDESDYCQLFEKCYSTEGKRRSYIESIIERKQPSVGYIVLANLIKYGYIRTVITTNFDSLISLACSNYTDIYPVVYSLGNFASEMQVSSERPRILKIHGDFLFSKLKNTKEDLQKPDENMERQFRRILEEYDGLIVIGYSGGDNSVMSLFEQIPDGKTIYWCDLSENSLSERARKFLADKNGTFVKIEGFDELMQIVRILIELDNKTIIKTFQDREIEINKKIGEFENVTLVDETTSEKVESNDPTDFAEMLDKSRDVTRLFIEGVDAYEQGNYELAETRMREVLEINPNNADAYYNLGVFIDDENRLVEVEEMYRKAIELKPDFSFAYNNLGRLLEKNNGNPADIEDLYRRAIKYNPVNVEAYNNLGVLLGKDENRLSEAEENYRRAIEINPHYAGAYNNLGNLFSKDANRLAEAEESYRKAIEINPNYAVAYNNFGALLAEDENRLIEAERNYHRAIEINPTYAKAYYNLGLLLANDKNRLAEAEEMYRKAIEIYPNDADFYYNLACLWSISRKKEKKKGAFEYLKKAIEMDSKFKSMAKKDSDFDFIRDDKRFREIVGEDE